MRVLVPSEPVVRGAFAFVLTLLAGLGLAGVPARADGPTLFVNDVAVVTLKTGGGGVTPARRAELAATAISASSSFEVSFAKEGAYGIVRIGDAKVVSIDATEARAHRKSIDALTREIAEKLSKAIESVTFFLAVRKVWMPLGGTASVAIEGPRADATSVKSDRSGVATVTQKDGTIQLTAESVGTSTVTVSYGQRAETLLVNVLLPAATIGTPSIATVMGRPADKQTVASAATRAVLSVIDAAPGAVVSAEAVSAPELVPAQKGTATVRVSVKAVGRYPVEQEIEVELKNEGMLETKAEELWYSNFPETILSTGRLYWGRVQEGRAARVLYHHLNRVGKPIEVKYMLVNAHDTIARVAVTMGDAPVHLNPTYAGYMAGEQFFPRWVRGSASVIEIPPHSSVPIVWQSVGKEQTVSGLMALHGVSGSCLFIGEAVDGVAGRSGGNFASAMPTESLSVAPMNLVGQSQHVYSPAEKEIKIDYRVGERWGYLRIGQTPVGRVDDAGKLDGNFGIVYKVEAVVTNPTTEATEVEFLFESSAGYTGAFFRINGLVYRTPLLQPKTTHQFMKVTMQPGESKTFYIETMPLSGGSYPCTVTIKPVGVG